MNLVNNVLTYRGAKQLIGKTTRTAFRRIHEVLVSFLDQAYSLVELNDLNTIQLGLSKSLVLVRYQVSRDQLSRDLGNILTSLIINLSKVLTDPSRPKHEKRQIIDRCRTFLDSLLVLVYAHTKR